MSVRAQPNVVLIVADDLGFGDVGYNGSEIQTPHLDQLAREGVVLNRFYAASQCSPSRAALLTGRYGVRMGINEPLSWADTLGLSREETTIADHLGAAGCATAMVGKWHLGQRCHHLPTDAGFDSFVGLLGGGASYFSRETPIGLDWWRGAQPERVDGYTTDLISDEAVDLLTRPHNGPLFLYLPFSAPHGPLEARPEDLALYPELTGRRQSFAALTSRLDHAIGQVMEAVRASREPTLVWFLSDNGGHPSHGGSNAPLKGMKGQSMEGGIRVPSVVWYPEWEPGQVDHPVWILDVLPTVLGLVGTDLPPRALDGADQGEQLAGAPATEALLERVFTTVRRVDDTDDSWRSAQTAEWKYVHSPLSAASPDRLYHISLDPTEQADSLDAYPQIAARLRERAEAFASLTRPEASRDRSLTREFARDFAACGGGAVALPARTVQERLDAWRASALQAGMALLLLVACAAFVVLARRPR